MTTQLSKSQREKTQRALDHHDRFARSYFWNPPSSAASRRRYEKQNTFYVAFRNNGVRYTYRSDVGCSGRNIYYTGQFEVNGERKTRRAFAKLLQRKVTK